MTGKRGRCSICGVLGPEGRHRNFLCEKCVDPQEIRVYCQGCGRRYNAPFTDKLSSSISEKLGLPIRPGTCIRVPFCRECAKDGKPPHKSTLEIFAIAKN